MKFPTTDRRHVAVRESYSRFPSWSQPFWTLLTGKPLPNEQPWLSLHPIVMAIVSVTVLLAAVSSHVALLNLGAKAAWAGIWLTPVFTVVVAGLLRKIQVVYVHHCAHGTFVRSRPAWNSFIGNCFTTLALIQNLPEYRREHFEHHNRTIFTTLRDADAALLFRFGLRPGSSKRRLRLILFCTLVSPAYHAYFLVARLRSNLLTRSISWRVASSTWLAVVAWILPSRFGGFEIAMAVWVPMVLGYQASALLQFLTEHVWLVSEQAPRTIEAYAQRCLGRFCGEALPAPGHVVGWIGWWTRTLLMHVPLRMGVLVGDLPAHDWHHLCGFVGHSPVQWPRAIFARQQAIDDGTAQGMDQRELWGLSQMLEHVLTAMAAAPEIAEQLAEQSLSESHT